MTLQKVQGLLCLLWTLSSHVGLYRAWGGGGRARRGVAGPIDRGGEVKEGIWELKG